MVKHTNSNHLEYIDALKGFGMFLVVMGHVIMWSFNCYGLNFWNLISSKSLNVCLWYNVIYSFHMPLLFWLSGFLFLRPNVLLHGECFQLTCGARYIPC